MIKSSKPNEDDEVDLYNSDGETIENNDSIKPIDSNLKMGSGVNLNLIQGGGAQQSP